MGGPRGRGPRARWPEEGSSRAMAFLQKIPRAYLELHLNPQHYWYVSLMNSFNPLALLEFSRARPDDSVHGGAAGSGTGWLRRPPEARVSPADGPTSTYGPSAHTKGR